MEPRYDLLQSTTYKCNTGNKRVISKEINEAGVAKPLRRFPCNRVQKLLNRLQYKGISTKVDVEGLFIQLNEDESPLRQVFLAMTQKELFIVKQEISSFTPKALRKKDTDTDGLSIDQILPFPTIHFFLVDDSTKYLTIITFTGKKYRFEMCQLDSRSTETWKKWRETITALNEHPRRTSSDPEVWKKSHVISLNNINATRCNVKSPAVRKPSHVMTYDVQDNKNDISGEKASDTPSISSSSSVADIFEKTRLGYNLRDRLSVLFTRGKFSPGENNRTHAVDLKVLELKQNMTDDNGDVMGPNTEESWITSNDDLEQLFLRKTRSLNDLLDQESQVFDIHTIKALLIRKRLGITWNAHSIKDRSSPDPESSSDSDDEIEKLSGVPSVMHTKGKNRTAGELWSLVRTRFIRRKKYRVIAQLQDIVRQVHFRILSQRDIYLAQSVIQLDVLDVSLQLTKMSRKLFLALSPTDIEVFTRSQGKEIRQSIEKILRFNEDIRKMVITEILKPRSLSGSVYVLKFFIQVGLKLLYQLHDFGSFIAIVRGLTSLPLYRLDRIWLALFIQEPFTFCHFLTIRQFQHKERQRSAYVSRVTTCLKRKVPFIPLLDHCLEHCLERANHQQSFPMFEIFSEERQSQVSTNLAKMKRNASSMPSISVIPEPLDKQSVCDIQDLSYGKTKSSAKSKEPLFHITPNNKTTLYPSRHNQNHAPNLPQTYFKGVKLMVSRFRSTSSAIQFLSRLKMNTGSPGGDFHKSTRDEKFQLLEQSDQPYAIVKNETRIGNVRPVSPDIQKSLTERNKPNTNFDSNLGPFDSQNISPKSVISELLNSQKLVVENQCKRIICPNFEDTFCVATRTVDPNPCSNCQLVSKSDVTSNSSKINNQKKSSTVLDVRERKALETLGNKEKDDDSNTEVFREDINIENVSEPSVPVISLRPIFSRNTRKRRSFEKMVVEGYFKDMVLARLNKHRVNEQKIEKQSDIRKEAGDKSLKKKSKVKLNKHDECFIKKVTGDRKDSQITDTAHINDGHCEKSPSVVFRNKFKIKDPEKGENNKNFDPKCDTVTEESYLESYEGSLYSVQLFLDRFEKDFKKYPQLIHYLISRLSNIRRTALEESQNRFKSKSDVPAVCVKESSKISHVSDEDENKELTKQIDLRAENVKFMRRPSETKPSNTFVSKFKKVFNKKKFPSFMQGVRNDIDEIADMTSTFEINAFQEEKGMLSDSQNFKENSLFEISQSGSRTVTRPCFQETSELPIAEQNRNIGKALRKHQTAEEASERNYKPNRLVYPTELKTVSKISFSEKDIGINGETKRNIKPNTILETMVNEKKSSEEAGNINTQEIIDKDGVKSKTNVIILQRKNSYIPDIVEKDKRKTKLEESLTTKHQEDENGMFEHLKHIKLCELEKKKSIVLDLLSPDEEYSSEEDTKAKHLNNLGKQSLLESVTNLFKHHSKTNNSNIAKNGDSVIGIFGHESKGQNDAEVVVRFERRKSPSIISSDNFNQNSLLKLKLLATDTEIDYERGAKLNINQSLNNNCTIAEIKPILNSCSLCSDKECLYQNFVCNHIQEAQINLSKVRIQSCQRAKDFLKSVFTINSYLTDYDLLQLSKK